MISKFKPTFQVPATVGKMGSTQYYTATLPFGAVAKLFVFDPDDMMELAPEDRAQRALNAKRVPDIADYILEHDDYIFSAITVSVDSDDVEFQEYEPGIDIGLLVLPLEAKYVINDGQHRVAGIVEALRQDPKLAEDTISVVVMTDGGLERSQQIFSDLNRTVHKTSKSLDILFDHRMPLNRITMACIEEVELFKNRIDKERVSLSVRSPKFATLSGLQKANELLLGDIPESMSADDEEELRGFCIEYWSRLVDVIDPWKDIVAGTVTAPEARQSYVSSYALTLWALGAAGAAAKARDDAGGDAWQVTIKKLSAVDWRKSNSEWQGICMTGSDIVTRAPTRKATAQQLKWKLDLIDEAPGTVLGAD